MFKGLRTKIESEQKGQTSVKTWSQAQQSHSTCQKSDIDVDDDGKYDSSSPSKATSVDEAPNHNPISVHLSPDILTGSNSTNLAQERDPARGFSHCDAQNEETGHQKDEETPPTITDLEHELLRLKDQLNSVIKEKDESNDQNSQLYQLIEKLRRNLESEKEISSSLQRKLEEVESALKKKNDSIDGLTTNKSTSGGSISIKTFESHLPSDETEPQSPNNVKILKRRINELQDQLSDKNRQLKIRQQNLNDIKKALQRELVEHGKTQDDLTKLRNQLKHQEQRSTDAKDCVSSLQNGSIDDTDMTSKSDINSNNDGSHHETVGQSAIVFNVESAQEDSTTIGTTISTVPQLDTMSCLSRSSASVDDFDSNDLHHNNYSKEVNHEYLRNVLFRYMTSTDSETSQHLVKALSVLMNFTPEQSAAIKSAMSARSSWLRLK